MIVTTKLPERPEQGFWFMVSDARTDVSMLMPLVFPLRTGAGGWSADARLGRSQPPGEMP